LPVLCVAPAGFVRSHIKYRAALERDGSRRRLGGLLLRRALGVADLDRVSALFQDAAPSASFFTRLAQADGVEAAEPHLAPTLVARVAEDPGFIDLAVLLASGDLQVEASPVRVPSRFRIPDRGRRQPQHLPRHSLPPSA
jgi:hypothetical protein